MFKSYPSLLIFLAGIIAAGCCPDDDGGVSLREPGQIELDPDRDTIGVDIGQTGIAGQLTFPVRIINVGQGPLTVEQITLTYTAPETGDQHGEAFTLTADQEFPLVLTTKGESAEGSETTVTVTFTRQEQFEFRTATLIIRSDSLVGQVKSVVFAAEQPAAVAQVSPGTVDFGVVAEGDVRERFIQVANTGTKELICDGFILQGNPDFTFHNGTDSYPVSEITASRVELETPIVILPNQTDKLRVTFSPTSAAAAAGEFYLYCNDAKGSTEGHLVDLVANQNVPCILVEPGQLKFGGQPVGKLSDLPITITNCGTNPLNLLSVALDTGGDQDFTLVPLPIDFSPQAPLVVSVNDSIEARIRYTPSEISPLDADNKAIPDETKLLVVNNSFEGEVEVPITGHGVDDVCPFAIASVVEGEQVIPQTTLHLKGDQSYSPVGLSIKNYFWGSEQPDGSTSQFIPSATQHNPVFDVNVSGLYTFTLTVTDDNNTESCEPATIEVIVLPDEAIHIELTWTTAGDPDMADTGEGNGTDFDLHFAHKAFTNGPDIDGDGSPDPWFDETFDVFWFNKTNNWGTFDQSVDDDPSLDRDDIDGWGPENLNLNIPEVAATYSIGVHYWDDHGFGESLATVRVFIFGELDTEVLDVAMQPGDMWNFGAITWIDGPNQTDVFTDDEGKHLITPNYYNPSFQPPE